MALIQILNQITCAQRIVLELIEEANKVIL